MEQIESDLEFFFPIEPQPKLRARLSKYGVYTPAKTVKYENEIKRMIKDRYKGPPLEGPLDVWCDFFMKKPKSSKNNLPVVKPDLDNLIKAVTDAANKLVWKDDSQIVSMSAKKVYSDKPGVRLLVIRI